MAEPVNHLAHRSGDHADLLRSLSDQALAEQMAWYVQAQNLAKNPRDRHGYSNLLSTAYAIQDERAHVNDTP